MPRSICFAVLFAALAVFAIEKSPRVAASGSPKPLAVLNSRPTGNWLGRRRTANGFSFRQAME